MHDIAIVRLAVDMGFLCMKALIPQSQVIRLLNISAPRFRRLLEAGLITPERAPGSPRKWFTIEAIELLQAKLESPDGIDENLWLGRHPKSIEPLAI